jgi:prefoldin subunit 5
MTTNESLQRVEELLERLRSKVDGLEHLAESGVDDLALIAEIAKELEGEIQRARQSAGA